MWFFKVITMQLSNTQFIHLKSHLKLKGTIYSNYKNQDYKFKQFYVNLWMKSKQVPCFPFRRTWKWLKCSCYIKIQWYRVLYQNSITRIHLDKQAKVYFNFMISSVLSKKYNWRVKMFCMNSKWNNYNENTICFRQEVINYKKNWTWGARKI